MRSLTGLEAASLKSRSAGLVPSEGEASRPLQPLLVIGKPWVSWLVAVWLQSLLLSFSVFVPSRAFFALCVCLCVSALQRHQTHWCPNKMTPDTLDEGPTLLQPDYLNLHLNYSCQDPVSK